MVVMLIMLQIKVKSIITVVAFKQKIVISFDFIMEIFIAH